MKKRVLSLAMALVMVLTLFAGMPLAASAADFTLIWPVSWAQGTPPAWAANATEAEADATIQAICDEYDYQASLGFDMGTMNGGITAWGNMVNVQFENGGHTTNPWGQTGRRMGGIISPYAGTAFSIKADYSQFYGVIPLGNATEYTDANGSVNTVQMITDGQLITQAGSAAITRSSTAYAGSGAPAAVADQFKKAYAETAAGITYGERVSLGYANGAVKTEGDIYYQEFWSNETTGVLDGKEGVAYIAGTADGAYVISGDMFTAWAADYGFEKTGAPTGNAYTVDGVTYQDFAKGALMLEDGEVSGPFDNDTSFSMDYDFENMAVEGSTYYCLVADDADVTKLDLGLTLNSEKSAMSPDLTGEQDYSEPVTVTVTAESGRSAEYTLTVFSRSSASEEDKAAAYEIRDMINSLPLQLFSNDIPTVEAMLDAYEALTTPQKMLVDQEAITQVTESLAHLGEGDKIRVTCVGDSITEGYGATDSAYSYPSQMQKILGDSYVVTNCGVSGSMVRTNRTSNVYIQTNRYQTSITSSPDIVIVALGTNDAGTGWAGSEAQFESDYRNLLNTYLNLPTNPLVLAALPTHSWYGGTNNLDNRDANNLAGTIPIIEKVAGELGVQVLDMYTWSADKRDYFGDGLHPNDAGYGLLAQEYAKYVLEATEEISDISLDGIRVAGEALADFSEATRNYTMDVASLNDLPEVTAVYTEAENKTVEVKQATADDPTAMVIVSSSQGSRGAAYSITFQPYPNPFTDVKDTDYFYAPAVWAVHEGITKGDGGEDIFNPNGKVTRAQVVTFLYRAAGSPEVGEDVDNPFTDVTGDYYYDAVLWAVEKGIAKGITETTFKPGDQCTRSQIVTFLHRFAETPDSAVENPFVDLPDDAYYYDAVLWAYENEITQGDGGEDTFNPEGICTRNQMVTFLYRLLG